jgi:hypothetical protein
LAKLKFSLAEKRTRLLPDLRTGTSPGLLVIQRTADFAQEQSMETCICSMTQCGLQHRGCPLGGEENDPMSTRVLSVAAIALWFVTIGVAIFFFIRGQTRVAPDGRTAVLLASDERDLVLAEMRSMLETVQVVVDGVKAGDMERVAKAARASGMAAAADVNPALMAKLPIEFKRLGLSVHRRFDEIAATAESGATREQLLASLGTQLSACVACHASYRLDTTTPAAK